MTRKKSYRLDSPRLQGQGSKPFKSGEPLDEQCIKVRIIPKGNMDTCSEVMAQFDHFDLNSDRLDHESFRAIYEMTDELQIWNAIVIVAHTKVINGEQSFGKELEHDLVGAIRSLKAENMCLSMVRLLRQIAQMSPNDIARAAARRKLKEAG